MPRNERTLLRRTLPTAHKILLNRFAEPRLCELQGEVVVVGAGKEPYTSLIPRAGSIVSTDIDKHEGVDFVADAHALPFPREAFDSLVAIEVFEHLHDPKQAAAEILRVLKENGTALVTVPFMFRVHGDPYDFQRWTSRGLEGLFRNFSEVMVQPFGNRLHVISDIVTTAARPMVVLRIFNHFFTLRIFSKASQDCPSGYLVKLRK